MYICLPEPTSRFTERQATGSRLLLQININCRELGRMPPNVLACIENLHTHIPRLPLCVGIALRAVLPADILQPVLKTVADEIVSFVIVMTSIEGSTEFPFT